MATKDETEWFEEQFEKFIDGLNLRHFKGAEFAPYWSRVAGGKKNACPPKELWENIVKTLAMLDELREHTGKPVTLTSTYRNAGYNAGVGGERGSFHMKFMACDIQVRDMRPANVFHLLQKWRQDRKRIKLPGERGWWTFTGGLGLYATFVHIDCRAANATW